MAHHLQCKLAEEKGWTTIASSVSPDALAATDYLSGLKYRYTSLGVLEAGTLFRITTDDQLRQEAATSHEVGGPLAATVIALFLGTVWLWGGILTGSV